MCSHFREAGKEGSGEAGNALLRRTAVRMTVLVLTAAVSLLACEREERNLQGIPPAASSGMPPVRQSDLQAGPAVSKPPVYSPYQGNAYGVSQGKTLYNQFNCSGCHFQGGGGIGPPLMDAEWIYGSRPENVFESIAEGRPNGMPSFGGKIVNDQIWQLVSYVRSMSGLLRKDVAPGRSDEMQVRPQEQATDKARPVQSGVPKSAEIP